MTRSVMLLSIFWFAAANLLTPVQVQGADDELDHARFEAIRKSVALLTFSGNFAKPWTATGFVIRRPSDHQPIIITAAHPIEGGCDVHANFPGDDEGVSCDLIDINGEVDLMALKPSHKIDVPLSPLEISAAEPADDSKVWLFGYPRGIEKPVWDPGRTKASCTAAKLPNDLVPFIDPGLKIPRGGTLLILHSAISAKGESGGPLIDQSGKVIAVQNSVIPDAPSDNFAVSIKHLHDLKLDASPDKTFRKGINLLRLNLQPAAEQQSSRPLSETDNARFLQSDVAAGDTGRFLPAYFGDADSLRREIGTERIQRFLKDQPLRRVINTEFGFQLLVPKGFACRPSTTSSPKGVQLIATSDDANLAPPYDSVTIRAFLLPDRYLHEANQALRDKLAKDGYPPQLAAKSGAGVTQAQYRHVYLASHIAGVWNVGFPIDVLKLRIRTPDNGDVLGPPDGEVFRVEDRNEDLPFTPFFRDHFISESSDLCYAVYGCVIDDTVIVASYAFHKSDLDRLHGGQDPSRDYVQEVLIRSSLQFY